MRPPRNDVFYTLVTVIAIAVALLFIFFLLHLHFSRRNFAIKARLSVWGEFSDAYDELHLKSRKKYFSFRSYFLGATYMSLSAYRVHCEEIYRAECYYNGSEYVCFLTDEKTDGRTIIECYTTKPCRRNVRAEEFKGQSVLTLYERLGKPAAAGLHDKCDDFGVPDESEQELILTYLIKGELFLSHYVYYFYIDEDDMVKDVKLVRIRFMEEV